MSLNCHFLTVNHSRQDKNRMNCGSPLISRYHYTLSLASPLPGKTITLELHLLHISVHPMDFIFTLGIFRTEQLLIPFFRIIILWFLSWNSVAGDIQIRNARMTWVSPFSLLINSEGRPMWLTCWLLMYDRNLLEANHISYPQEM